MAESSVLFHDILSKVDQMRQDPLADKDSTNSSTHSTKSEPDEEWRTRTHLGIMVENIPAQWMVYELKSFLDGFGTVVKAEIFEDRQVPHFTASLSLDWKA
jgi:hypothetical protein